MKARMFKKLFKDVSTIVLNKNDIVAIHLKDKKQFTQQEITSMYNQLKMIIPNNRIMILPHDMEVKIIREQ